MRKSALILLLGIVLNISFGQTIGFLEGTITMKDGRVIKGDVEMAITYYTRVAYLTKEGKEFSVKCSEVRTIQTPYRYIENISIGKKEILMGLVSDGYIRLFSYVTPGGNTPPYIQTIYTTKKDGKFTQLTRKDFREKLVALLDEQQALVARIKSGEFTYENIEGIIKEFNELHRIQALQRRVTARIIDSETKKPIKDAKVIIQGKNLMVSSNALGFIQLTLDAADTMVIQHPEYETGQVKLPATDHFTIALIRTSSEKH